MGAKKAIKNRKVMRFANKKRLVKKIKKNQELKSENPK